MCWEKREKDKELKDVTREESSNNDNKWKCGLFGCLGSSEEREPLKGKRFQSFDDGRSPGPVRQTMKKFGCC